MMADVVVVGPSLLEPASERGGGMELIDLKISRYLSQSRRVALIGPFYPDYSRSRVINENCWIEEVLFPAQPRYPPTPRLLEYIIVLFLAPLYSILLSVRIVGLAKLNNVVLVVHNGLPGLCACLVGKILHRRLIFSEGNTYPWTNPYMIEPAWTFPKRVMRILKLLCGRVIGQLSDSVRAQSESIRNGMVRFGIEPTKVTVIPPGIDILPMPAPKVREIEDGIFRVGFVGRLTDEKGAPLLAEIVKLARTELPLVRFLVMGEGVYRKLLVQSPNVEQLGWLTKDELAQSMDRVDALVFFQREIGLGELEGMAAGKAIIACDAGEMRNVIQNRKNGLLCEPNAVAFLEAIRLLQRDRLLTSKISNGAIETARSRYDWTLVGPQWVSLVSSLSARP